MLGYFSLDIIRSAKLARSFPQATPRENCSLIRSRAMKLGQVLYRLRSNTYPIKHRRSGSQRIEALFPEKTTPFLNFR